MDLDMSLSLFSAEDEERIRCFNKLFECAVCKGPLEDSLQLKCGHILCVGCIKTMQKVYHSKCPLCNQKIARRAIRPRNDITQLANSLCKVLNTFTNELAEEQGLGEDSEEEDPPICFSQKMKSRPWHNLEITALSQPQNALDVFSFIASQAPVTEKKVKKGKTTGPKAKGRKRGKNSETGITKAAAKRMLQKNVRIEVPKENDDEEYEDVSEDDDNVTLSSFLFKPQDPKEHESEKEKVNNDLDRSTKKNVSTKAIQPKPPVTKKIEDTVTVADTIVSESPLTCPVVKTVGFSNDYIRDELQKPRDLTLSILQVNKYQQAMDDPTLALKDAKSKTNRIRKIEPCDLSCISHRVPQRPLGSALTFLKPLDLSRKETSVLIPSQDLDKVTYARTTKPVFDVPETVEHEAQNNLTLDSFVVEDDASNGSGDFLFNKITDTHVDADEEMFRFQGSPPVSDKTGCKEREFSIANQTPAKEETVDMEVDLEANNAQKGTDVDSKLLYVDNTNFDMDIELVDFSESDGSIFSPSPVSSPLKNTRLTPIKPSTSKFKSPLSKNAAQVTNDSGESATTNFEKPKPDNVSQATSDIVTGLTGQKKKYIFCPTRLSKAQLKELQAMCAICDGRTSNDLTDEVTHLIIYLEGGRVPQTMKYLLAIAGKKWVITFDWVRECLKRNCIVPEGQFETSNFPDCDIGPRYSRESKEPLFNGYSFYIPGSLMSSGASVDACKELLQKLGAAIIDNPFGVDDSVMIIGDEMDNLNHVFQDWFEIKGWVTVAWEWVLDCILNFGIEPFRPSQVLTVLDEHGLARANLPERLIRFQTS